MSVFAISDLHLSNSAEKPMDIYGGQWLNHTKRIKEAWLDLIGEEDTVILPGDISWGLRLPEAMADLQWISELPGEKVLFKGNHDLWWASISKLSKLFETMHFIQNGCYEGENFVIGGTRGWICPGTEGFTQQDKKIYDREIGRLRLSLNQFQDNGKMRIGVMHFPPTNETLRTSDFTSAFQEYRCEKVIYGHLHGKDAYKNGLQGMRNGVEYILTSCDKLGCIPLKIWE